MKFYFIYIITIMTKFMIYVIYNDRNKLFLIHLKTYDPYVNRRDTNSANYS